MTHPSPLFSPKGVETKPRFENFESSLSQLVKIAQKDRVSFETFFLHFVGKGRTLLLIAVCLAFGHLPVVSIAGGLMIGYLGFRMTFFNNKIWLPRFFLRTKVPTFFFKGGIKPLIQMLKFIRRGTKPRFEWTMHHWAATKINGLLIALTGLSFACAPLIPFFSYPAYLALLFISIGILNEDGIYILIGYLLSLFYFSSVVVVNKYFSIIDLCKFIKRLIV